MNRQSGDQHWTRRMPERVRRGPEGNGAKLTQTQIEEIRYLASQMGSSASWLAARYGVSRITIWRQLKAQSRATDRCADVNT